MVSICDLQKVHLSLTESVILLTRLFVPNIKWLILVWIHVIFLLFVDIKGDLKIIFHSISFKSNTFIVVSQIP